MSILPPINLWFPILAKLNSKTKSFLATSTALTPKSCRKNEGFWVYVPNTATSGLYAQAKYPVVYLLDGNLHFYSVVGMIQLLSSVYGNMICPEMIVVGIPNTDRTKDLTPSHVFLSNGEKQRLVYVLQAEASNLRLFWKRN